MALEMRDKCERCAAPLGWQANCLICSYECTWCPPCGAALAMICPNCGGELKPRPKRQPPD